LLIRLNKTIACKQDCNFQRLLSVASCFSSNETAFALAIIQVLQPNSAGQCRNQFPKLKLGNLSATQLASNPCNFWQKLNKILIL